MAIYIPREPDSEEKSTSLQRHSVPEELEAVLERPELPFTRSDVLED